MIKNITIIYNFILPYMKKYITQLFFNGVIIFLFSILLLPVPFLTKTIIDNSIPNKDFRQLLLISILSIFILIVRESLGLYQSLIIQRIHTKIIIDIKKDIIIKLNLIPFNKLKSFDPGYLLSRINSDTSNLQTFFINNLVEIIKNILTFIIGSSALLYLDWQLSIIIFSSLPIYIFISKRAANKSVKLAEIAYSDTAFSKSTMLEALNLIGLNKIFKRYKKSIVAYLKSQRISFNSSYKLIKLNRLTSTALNFIAGIVPIIIFCYGGYKVMNEDITLGSLIAFGTFVGYVISPINSIMQQFISFKQAVVSFRWIMSILDIDNEKISVFEDKFVSIDSIEFRNIFFKYNDKDIINNLNFKINTGDKIGIVGKSGSGKTTLLYLLLGLYTIDSGIILINNKQIEIDKINMLRKLIAFIPQESLLFEGTIYDNIKFSRPNSSKEEVVKAAKDANILDFINSSPNNFNTVINKNGSNLSVGQKQRIAIARALLKNPKILILDEATSSIDNFSEKYITETIKNLPKDMIVIIVAHRLSTIKDCDKIFVMDKGSIVEKGKHDILMSKKGLYFELNSVMNKN